MKWVERSEIDGVVRAPASKSQTIRAAAAALLGNGTTTIAGPSDCDDALAAFDIAASLGAAVEREANLVRVRGGLAEGERAVDCRESGLCMRLFAPVGALRRDRTVLRASGSLGRRPMAALEGPIRRLGGECRTAGGLAPVEVCGPLAGGRAVMDGSLGSQFLTGFMMALPLAGGDSELTVTGLRSRPYADMTVSLLREFGVVVEHEEDYGSVQIPGNQTYRSTVFEVDGDWSGAAFLLVAGAMRGRVTVTGLRPDPGQADGRVLEAIEQAGANVAWSGGSVTIVSNGRLKAFSFDAGDSPDLFPPLVALAVGAEGGSRIRGVGRLKHKESDRGTVLLEEFGRLGVRLSIDGDELVVEGGRLEGGTIDPRGDHRIAMAGAVAGLSAATAVGIKGHECVAKSYPGFFEDLRTIGGRVS